MQSTAVLLPQLKRTGVWEARATAGHCYHSEVASNARITNKEVQMATGRRPAIRAGNSGLAKVASHVGIGDRMTDAIMNLISTVPSSSESTSTTPDARAKLLTRNAARASAGISGGAALAPGPLGMLTVLPDIIGVWRVQAQMVSDIAGAYGKTGTVTREQMVYCLFKHSTAQLLRDVIVREGERYLVLPVSLRMMRSIATKIGVKVGQRSLGKVIARYAPVVGALGVGAYAYYDTQKVGKSAIELFGSEVVVAPGGSPVN